MSSGRSHSRIGENPGRGAVISSRWLELRCNQGRLVRLSLNQKISRVKAQSPAPRETVSGSFNTASGRDALRNSLIGNRNIAVGFSAGSNITGDDNIDIGHFGVAGESNTTRIGRPGFQNRAFVVGVRGVTTGSTDTLPVLIDVNGQLGTLASSASVKRDIDSIRQPISALLQLRPVSFFYRHDTVGIRQYGLIAEEVAEVMPELVHFSADGKPETVRYHFLPPLLLNELQKQHDTIEEQRSHIAQLEARLATLEKLLQKEDTIEIGRSQ